MSRPTDQLSNHKTQFSVTIQDAQTTIFVSNINLDVNETNHFLNSGLLFPAPTSPPGKVEGSGNVPIPPTYTPTALLLCAVHHPHVSSCSADGVFDTYPQEIILKRLDIVPCHSPTIVHDADAATTEKRKRKEVKQKEGNQPSSPTSPLQIASNKNNATPTYRLRDYSWFVSSGHDWQLTGPARVGLRLKVLVVKKPDEDVPSSSASSSSTPLASTIPIAPTSDRDRYAQHPALALNEEGAADTILPSALFADISITVTSHQSSNDATEQFAAVAAEHKAIKILNAKDTDDADDEENDELRKRKRVAEAFESDTLGPRRTWRLLLHRRWFMIRPEVRQATVRDSFAARHKYELAAHSLQQALDAEREERYGHPDGRIQRYKMKKRRGGRRTVYDEDDDWDSEDDSQPEDSDEEDDHVWNGRNSKRVRAENSNSVANDDEEGEEHDERYPYEKLSRKFPTLEQRLHRIRLAAKEKYSGSVHEALAVSSCGKFVMWRDGTETPMSEVQLYESTFVPANNNPSATNNSTNNGTSNTGIVVYKHPHRYSDVIGTIPFGTEATAIGMTTNKFTGEVFVCWKQLFVPSREVSVVAPIHSKETYRTHPSFYTTHASVIDTHPEPVVERARGKKSLRNGNAAAQSPSEKKNKANKESDSLDCPDLIPVEDSTVATWNDMTREDAHPMANVAPTIAPEGIIGWSVLKGFTETTQTPNTSLSPAQDIQPTDSTNKGKSLSAIIATSKSMIKGKKADEVKDAPQTQSNSNDTTLQAANQSIPPVATSPTFFLVEKKLQGCQVFDTARYFTSARVDRGVRIRAEPSIHSKQIGVMDANEVKEAVALHVDKLGNIFLEWKEMATSPGYDNAEISPVPNTCDNASALTYSVIQEKKKRLAQASAANTVESSTSAAHDAQSVVASTDVNFTATQPPVEAALSEPRAQTPVNQVVIAAAVEQVINNADRHSKGHGKSHNGGSGSHDLTASPSSLAATRAKKSNGGYSLVRGPQGPGGGTFLVEIFPFNRTLAPLNFADISEHNKPAVVTTIDSDDDNATTEANGNKKKSMKSYFQSKEPFRFTSTTPKDEDDEVIDLDREKDKRRRALAFVDSLARSRAKLLKASDNKGTSARVDNNDDAFTSDEEEEFEEDEEGDEYDDMFEEDDEDYSDEEDEDDFDGAWGYEGSDGSDSFEDDWYSDEGDEDDDDDDMEDFLAPRDKSIRKVPAAAPHSKKDAKGSKKTGATATSNTKSSTKVSDASKTTSKDTKVNTKQPIVEEPTDSDSAFASEFGSNDYDAAGMDEGSFEGSDDASQYEDDTD